ncbi:MAG: low molecular weight protein arginine phosphatase [Thermoanaerobacterales bacterium]|nr:low molecular weight protein arginine phosphatase [Bacillota bacterium]MDI6906379.1 low molecular weight protein arginine phosphatase [Thermoanaerobacterales bacterium]
MAKKILFVCSGNTCRSPMAEGLARHLLPRPGEWAAGEEEILVFSAGVHALPGDPATENAVEALAEDGIDLRRHRAALLTREMIHEADLVLTMTAGHRRLVREMAPDQAGKVFTLAEYAGVGGDLPDPFGQPPAVYRRYAGELRHMVRLALERFRRENAGAGRK